MNQRSSTTKLFLAGPVLISLIGFTSHVLPGSRASQEALQEKLEILDISTPKIEYMVDVNGRNLHCCVYGKGSPTVVLVSGLEAPQAYWNSVIPDLAAETTVVTYDRAGVGKSEIGGLPMDGEQSARDLHVLLEKLAVPRPCVLVGHSYGGNVVRLFASMYPADMGGLILEDTQHEDVLDELRKILKGKDLEAFDQLMTDRFSAPEVRKTEADYRDVTRDQLRNSKPLPRMPYVILSSGDERAKAMQPMFSAEAIVEIAKLDFDLQEKLAALIPGGRLVIVEGAGHDIHVGKPKALIIPVVEMIKEVRKKS